MREKLSERLHSAIINEVGYAMAFEQLLPETQALLKEVEDLGAELEKANRLAVKLAMQKGEVVVICSAKRIENQRLRKELANVRREALFAISKAESERAEHVRDEADLNGYSRGVADTESRLSEAEKFCDGCPKMRAISSKSQNPISPVPELIPELISLTKAMGLELPQEERTTFRYFTVWHQRANRSVVFVHEMGLIWHMKVCMEGMGLGESPTVLTFRQGEQVLPSHVELRGCEAHETPYAYFWYPRGDAWAIIPYLRQNYVELRNLFEELPWSEGAPIEEKP